MSVNVKKWCLVLENTFLKYTWTAHAKKYTYTERTEILPEHIEKVVHAYKKGNNQYIRVREGYEPNNKLILHLIPALPLLITVVIDNSVNPWKIVTYYYSEDTSKYNESHDDITN